jgi:integrase/recombinase XerD
MLHNSASELDLPKQGHHLPRDVPNVGEVKQVFQQPDLSDPIGLRDRAILEVPYSTDKHRMEIAGLKLAATHPGANPL